ncbi:3-(3-hydroxy-phenyl)propionate hydroxylase [Sphingobium sp. AP50]|uniref:FAD-dependent oxidoreductase n=1 Tax=Sphingobium sp. AP50 TaxID=1884369 RepID=UPI0008B95288|nr:NAD(P)/FAD-dependent oxidoreductase [Sphingobium sp. AP50]SEJ96778.1 3-(3-hydroxy-phenyl)propionate hydroxylase [Sphingobium sp. AP50]
MRKVEALVVGAGPVGTIAASRLAAMNIDVMLCEAQSSCAHDLRASTFHASTLEMLDEIDAVAPLIDRGLKAPVYHMRDRQSGAVIDFDLAEIADRARFPFRLQCEQFHMANLLAQRMIDDPKIDMRFNARLVDARETADGVIATIEDNGILTEVFTKFLIGADGSRSVVREKMGVAFEGFTYEEKFVSLSTALPIEDHVPNLSYVNYISDPDEWLVLLRVPTLWRVLVPADGALTNEELISDANAAKVFSRIVGDVPVVTEHRTIYRVHQRVAERFVKGRMLLIGDAAHLNNPLGGFGMNSGIHDAWNLTEKVYAILRQDGDKALLDRFDRQRRTVTRNFIQAQTIENMAFMEQGAGEASRLRRERMAQIHADPDLRRDHLLKQAMFKSLEEAESIA